MGIYGIVMGVTVSETSLIAQHLPLGIVGLIGLGEGHSHQQSEQRIF